MAGFFRTLLCVCSYQVGLSDRLSCQSNCSSEESCACFSSWAVPHFSCCLNDARVYSLYHLSKVRLKLHTYGHAEKLRIQSGRSTSILCKHSIRVGCLRVLTTVLSFDHNQIAWDSSRLYSTLTGRCLNTAPSNWNSRTAAGSSPHDLQQFMAMSELQATYYLSKQSA